MVRSSIIKDMTIENIKDVIKALRDEYRIPPEWIDNLMEVFLDGQEELSRLRRFEDLMKDNQTIRTLRDSKSNAEWRRIVGYLKQGSWITKK